MSHDGVEFGIIPIAPADGKQDGRAAHTESDGHESDFGFGEPRRFLETSRARMKRETAEGARIVNGASGAFEAAAEKKAQQEARENAWVPEPLTLDAMARSPTAPGRYLWQSYLWRARLKPLRET
jgi:predicted phage gp36 major capsid-like protein